MLHAYRTLLRMFTNSSCQQIAKSTNLSSSVILQRYKYCNRMNSISIFSDPVVTCPYDKYHRVALSKIQYHIVRCEKNYPVGYKETCPYNATHRLFKHELQDHLISCPQRSLLHPEIYQHVENHGSQMADFIAQSIADSVIDHGESWDAELQSDSEIGANLNSGSSLNRRTFDDPSVNLRPPRGYSEAMMMGGDSDVAEPSDMESVVSVMGVGRGRVNPNNIQLYRRLNFGRGRCPPAEEA